MKEAKLVEKLDFLTSARGEDEATVLAAAVRAGIETLYREALVEGFLEGRIPRDRLLSDLGPAHVAEIEQQRDALRRDVAWGLRGA